MFFLAGNSEQLVMYLSGLIFLLSGKLGISRAEFVFCREIWSNGSCICRAYFGFCSAHSPLFWQTYRQPFPFFRDQATRFA